MRKTKETVTNSKRSSRARPNKAAPSRAEAVEGYTYDQSRADRVSRFLETFVVMSEGRGWAGKPLELMEWQRKDIIDPIFGWVDATGLRRYRRAYIEVPKKAGKSTLMAGLVLYFLLADGEPGAQVYGAAVDRIQAGLIYRSVAASIRKSPALSACLEVIDSRSTIIHKDSGSRYTCLSADSWRAEGINASAVVIDELHAHKNRSLVDALVWAGSSREQPLTIAISTAGHNRNSIGWQWHQDAELVTAEPKANPTFFGKIYSAPVGSDYSLPAVWKQANPSLGKTITLKSFSDDYVDALTNPSKYSAFLRYRLGVWTEPDNRWFTADAWSACGDSPTPCTDGRPVYVGLDLASSLDITAAIYLTPAADGSYDLEARFWIPEASAAERTKRDQVPYLEWIAAGWITATDGSRCDYDKVVADIVEAGQTRNIRSIGIDMWNAGSTASRLQEAGLSVVSISQSMGSLTAPSKLLESLVAGKKIRHGGNPVLAWMANNVVVTSDSSGNIKPDKGKSTEKIDGILATVLALAMASTAEVEATSWDMIQL